MRPMQESGPAEVAFADDGRFPRETSIRHMLSTAIGACVAVGLILTAGAWVYRLSVRDAGKVPIIQAAATPAKVRPEDPGGAVVPYQNITSYQIAGPYPVEPVSVTLAPPPAEPRREDVAMGKPGSGAAEQASAPAQATAGEPVTRTRSAEAEAAGSAVAPADPVPDASEYAPALSPEAPHRPPDLKERMAAAAQAAERRAETLAHRAASSDIQLQLAAAPEESTVHRMWRRISKANTDILHDRDLAVQTTVSGGRTYYRLRVGPFDGMSEARAVCQALRARGQDCVVARNG